MKVIVCGAGQVGSTIARHLASEGIDVTVIDSSIEMARRADESYDVRAIVGHAAHPDVLERAGARNADMLIAVTRFDEVNMVACQVAHSLFKVGRRIARVRHNGYLAPIWKGLFAADQMPIDVIISPEIEVAKGIARRLRTPGAFDSVALSDGQVQLLGIHCNTGRCSFVGRRLDELDRAAPDLGAVVVAIIRDGRAMAPRGVDRIEEGDDVYVVTQPARVDRVMRFFGHEEQVARRILIIGGGNVGLTLARRILEDSPGVALKIIEQSRERAEFVAREVGGDAVVLHGDALDREMLEQANAAAAETVVAVTNDDETNIFSSVLSKREGCERAITLVNKTFYGPVLPGLGIDAVVSPNAITISTILRHVRHRSISALYTVHHDFGEVIEATAQVGSRLVSGPLRDIGLPDGMLIGAIVRDGEVEIPTGASLVQPGDVVIAMVTYQALRKAEAILTGGGLASA